MALYSTLEDLTRGFGWRRMWMFSRNRIGFSTKGFFLLYLFLPHLIAAMGMVLVGLAALLTWPLGIRIGELPPFVGLILVPFGGVFTCVLGPMILGRRTTVLDRSRQEFKETVGLRLLFLPMLPLAWRRTPFTEFRAASLTIERRHFSKQSHEVHCISLVRKGGEKTIVVDARSELSGRRIAEDVARFVNLPLEDSTVGETVTRVPDRLDESLVDQARRAGEADTTLWPPHPLEGQYTQEGSEQVIRFERPPFADGLTVRAMLAGIVLGTIAAFVIPTEKPSAPAAPAPLVEKPQRPVEEPSPWPHRIELGAYWTLYGVRAIGLGGAVLALLLLIESELKRKKGYEIRCGAAGLSVRVCGFGLRRTHVVSAAQLEEIRLEKGSRLVAMSDRKIVRFPDSLSQQEAEYLRSVLVKALAGNGNREPVAGNR